MRCQRSILGSLPCVSRDQPIQWPSVTSAHKTSLLALPPHTSSPFRASFCPKKVRLGPPVDKPFDALDFVQTYVQQSKRPRRPKILLAPAT